MEIIKRNRIGKLTKWMSAAPASILFVLVLVVFGLCGEYSTLSCHFIACQILIVGSDLVYQTAIRQNLDDTVGSGLYELVVMTGEQCHTGELDQTVVQRGDGFISVPIKPPAVSSSYFNKSTISPACSTSSICERISSWVSSSNSRIKSTASSVSMLSTKRLAISSLGSSFNNL